jgi:hypothetical protein
LQGSPLDALQSDPQVSVKGDTLVLSKVGMAQSGTYRCAAKNQIGEGQSNAVSLDVKCKSTRNAT